jgi:hypothetical protein
MDEWKEAAKFLWGILIPVGAWAWNKQDKRLESIEGRMVTKEAVAERKHEVDNALEARRQGEIALHAKIEAHADQDREMFQQILSEMRGLGAGLARIEGRLER